MSPKLLWSLVLTAVICVVATNGGKKKAEVTAAQVAQNIISFSNAVTSSFQSFIKLIVQGNTKFPWLARVVFQNEAPVQCLATFFKPELILVPHQCLPPKPGTHAVIEVVYPDTSTKFFLREEFGSLKIILPKRTTELSPENSWQRYLGDQIALIGLKSPILDENTPFPQLAENEPGRNGIMVVWDETEKKTTACNVLIMPQSFCGLFRDFQEDTMLCVYEKNGNLTNVIPGTPLLTKPEGGGYALHGLFIRDVLNQAELERTSYQSGVFAKIRRWPDVSLVISKIMREEKEPWSSNYVIDQEGLRAEHGSFGSTVGH